MSTLTVAARSTHDEGLRPVPWRRMAWVAWRQHRLTLAGVVALLSVASVYLLISGLPIHSAYAPVAACRPATSDLCTRVASDFLGTYAPGVGVTAGLLQVIPALIGAFAGAPLLAREFETGTFRFAWTQGFGRTRWTIAKVTPLAIAIIVAAGAFSALFSWYLAPIFGAGDGNGPLAPTTFDQLGIALAGWTLAAFSIGVLAGAVVRRVIPAMFATFAVWGGVAVATALFLRPHYAAPVVTGNPDVPPGNWILSQVWSAGGKPVNLDMINQTLRGVDIRAVTPDLFEPGPATPPGIDPIQYLTQHGYLQITTYQPMGRFWPFQLIEGGWLLMLSVVLIATAVWLVRRRAA